MPQMTEMYSYLIRRGFSGGRSILECHADDHGVVFNYLAMDHDGAVYAFETDPVIVPEFKRWAAIGGTLMLQLGSLYTPGLDWTTTKVKLPTPEADDEHTFLVTIKEVTR